MKNVMRFTILVALTMASLPAFGQSNIWTVDPVHSQANFEIRHLAVTTVRGAITNVTGTVTWDPKDPTKDHVEAVLDATTVTLATPIATKT